MVKLLLIADFAYNNIENISIDYTLSKLNCEYHQKSFFENKTNLQLRFCFANKLANKLKKWIEICYQNQLYIDQQLKRAYDREVKSHSYTFNEKVLLNSKYIKIKQN